MTPLTPEEVIAAEQALRPVIDRAMTYSNTETTGDLFAQALADKAQFWRLGDGVAVTRIEQGKVRVLKIVAVAGAKMSEWIDAMVDAWKLFAWQHGCVRIIAIGRSGWAREFRRHGFGIEYIAGVHEVQHA